MEFYRQMSQIPLSERLDQSSRLMKKFYPKLPVIIDRANSNTPQIDKNKYLIDPDMTVANVLTIIRKRVKLNLIKPSTCLLIKKCLAYITPFVRSTKSTLPVPITMDFYTSFIHWKIPLVKNLLKR